MRVPGTVTLKLRPRAELSREKELRLQTTKRKGKKNTKEEKLEETRKWSIAAKNEGNTKSCEKAYARTSTR